MKFPIYYNTKILVVYGLFCANDKQWKFSFSEAKGKLKYSITVEPEPQEFTWIRLFVFQKQHKV